MVNNYWRRILTGDAVNQQTPGADPDAGVEPGPALWALRVIGTASERLPGDQGQVRAGSVESVRHRHHNQDIFAFFY